VICRLKTNKVKFGKYSHISYSIFDIPYIISGIEPRIAGGLAMEFGYGIWNMEYGI
jgi:hypothetical protein